MDLPFEKATPPKSADRIRAVLDSVHRQVDQRIEAGPDRITDDTRLIVATFHQPEAGRHFQEVLLRAGIMSEGTFHRNGAEISIDLSDYPRAAQLLQQHLAEFPDQPREASQRDFDCTIFGSLLGGAVGLILGVGEMEGWRLALMPLFSILFGGMSGFFLDRSRGRYRHEGSLQFGVVDVLAMTALIALGFFIHRLIFGAI